MKPLLAELYKKRGLMPVWNEKETEWEERRKEILRLLCTEEYGFMPKQHNKLIWETESEEKNFCAGKVTLKKVILTAYFGEESVSFPIYTSIPNNEKKHPFFVLINFRDNVPDRYLPIEEICDRGYAVISFCYNDVTIDGNEAPLKYKNHIDSLEKIMSACEFEENIRCGKLAMWAWAASRVMDYAETLDCLDCTNTAVVGHSRLGKTALLAGALDERFACAISNDSGCSGAAISRQKKGEDIKYITETFGYWFCENYKKYAGNEDKLLFDQHFLIAAMAPRKVYVASAAEDEWADPESELLACYAASEVYDKLGISGLVCQGRLPEAGESFHEGSIGYHLRDGTHYFSREDWNYFMDYLDVHLKKS